MINEIPVELLRSGDTLGVMMPMSGGSLRDYLSDINLTQFASALNTSRSRLSTAMRPRL
ncbi:hypothetical protein KCP77_21145 [Salmonella enterica subsp. enterica]|nr:hypothetical protein KCP77_21145 [Salmonella enterica subsp. enterica]